MNVVKFKGHLNRLIDMKVAETLASKDPQHQFLTYWEFQNVTGSVRNVFLNSLEIIPCQIEGACKMAEAVLAPDAKTRNDLIKAAASATGGVAGIAAIIAGVGAALGWGAGVMYAVTTFFVGAPFLGPLGWGACGAALLLISLGISFFRAMH